jgi:hypothetical protein
MMENPAIQISLEGLKVLLQALTGKQLNNGAELEVDDIVSAYYKESSDNEKDQPDRDWLPEVIDIIKEATSRNPRGIDAKGIQLQMRLQHQVNWQAKGITGKMKGFMNREPKLHKIERGWYAYNDEA